MSSYQIKTKKDKSESTALPDKNSASDFCKVVKLVSGVQAMCGLKK